MRAERAEYGATELMFHPRVIILPAVTQGHWDGWRQDVRKNKAFKEKKLLKLKRGIEQSKVDKEE